MRKGAGCDGNPVSSDITYRITLHFKAEEIGSLRLADELRRTMIRNAQRNEKMNSETAGADKKIAAGILGILLGALGIHKFILGYTAEGIIMLLVSLIGAVFIFPPFIMGVIGLIEGIIYLTKSDEDFVRTYVTNKKGWL
jgi:TM2 domain-containing membrane protein YozV